MSHEQRDDEREEALEYGSDLGCSNVRLRTLEGYGPTVGLGTRCGRRHGTYLLYEQVLSLFAIG